jgi:hypothetical protein
MQFGEGLSVEEGHAQMSYAYERGVNFFGEFLPHRYCQLSLVSV